MDYKAVIILFNTIVFIAYAVIFIGFLVYYFHRCDDFETIEYNVARKNLFISLITIGVLVIGNLLFLV